MPVKALEPCPRCLALRFGDDDPFCEVCGHRFGEEWASPSETGQWELVIAADREQYERSGATEIAFPDSPLTRVVELSADEVRIGRRSASRNAEPEVDLSTEPEDPAVSHMHALLVRQGDGSYAICDLGSTNGTTINDETEALEANEIRPLESGDRIHLGAWTTLTVRCRL
jgi:pSer/pThr/pTyr-binding forkhead associated (FHA) protein